MGFTTYENTANPHVMIHRDGCRQLRKRGGVYRYGHKQHKTFEAARAYANSTGLGASECSFCHPSPRARCEYHPYDAQHFLDIESLLRDHQSLTHPPEAARYREPLASG